MQLEAGKRGDTPPDIAAKLVRAMAALEPTKVPALAKLVAAIPSTLSAQEVKEAEEIDLSYLRSKGNSLLLGPVVKYALTECFSFQLTHRFSHPENYVFVSLIERHLQDQSIPNIYYSMLKTKRLPLTPSISEYYRLLKNARLFLVKQINDIQGDETDALIGFFDQSLCIRNQQTNSSWGSFILQIHTHL